MAERKAHMVDDYIKKPDPAFPVALIYGSDRGLVSERAKKLAQNSGIDLQDPFSIMRLSADEAATDPATVSDEAHSISMFGGKRLVWITGTTQKQLIKAIQPLLETPPKEALVIVEGGDLKKTVALRKQVEKATNAIALPCYPDTAKALDAMIDEELAAAGLHMDKETRNLLVSQLGNDRLVSRSQVQKLMLYCADTNAVTADDVLLNIGDTAAVSADGVVDAVVLGKVETLDAELSRLLEQNNNMFSLLSASQRYFQTLHELRSQMDAANRPASSVLGQTYAIPYPRKATAERALSVWTTEALTRTLRRIDNLVLESRSKPGLDGPLTATALLAIALEGRRFNR